MEVKDTKRCDNLACVCDVPLSTDTCGEYCSSLSGRDMHNIRCECGHPACAKEMERELSGEMGASR